MALRFKNLEIYQKAKDFAKMCREKVKMWNKEKGLANQIIRASNSVVLNIAEGSACESNAEFTRFLTMSLRSVYEILAGFDLAESLGVVKNGSVRQIEQKAEVLIKQIQSFKNVLKNKNEK
jgi:four helix bundle protein